MAPSWAILDLWLACDDDHDDADEDTEADGGDGDAANGIIYFHRWPLQSDAVHDESCQMIALICPDDR